MADICLTDRFRESKFLKKMKTNRFRNLYWFFAPLLIFLVFRVLVIYAVYNVTTGIEFTSDLWVFELGLKPLSVITFTSEASNFSQPPLFPIVLAPIAISTSQIFDRFLAARISFVVFELTSFLIMSLYLFKSNEILRKDKSIILSIIALSPLGLMTGAVMKQEEAIVMVFTAAVLMAVKNNSTKWACLLTFLGVITGKILFGIVFFALLLYEEKKRKVLFWGILPTFAFLAIYGLIGFKLIGVFPFVDFAPSDTKFCSSIFTLYLYFGDFSGPVVKWISLCMVAALLLIVWILRSRFTTTDFPSHMLLAFCALFLFFYHTNTEYYIFILPLLALIAHSHRSQRSKYLFNGAHLMLAISAWGFGIIYGIRIFSESEAYYSNSKQMAFQLYERFFGFIPIKSLEIGLLLMTVVSIIVIFLLTYRILSTSTESLR